MQSSPMKLITRCYRFFYCTILLFDSNLKQFIYFNRVYCRSISVFLFSLETLVTVIDRRSGMYVCTYVIAQWIVICTFVWGNIIYWMRRISSAMFQENGVLLVHEYIKDGILNSVQEALIYADRLRGWEVRYKKENFHSTCPRHIFLCQHLGCNCVARIYSLKERDNN